MWAQNRTGENVREKETERRNGGLGGDESCARRSWVESVPAGDNGRR